MTKRLHIAKNLILPLEAATETFAILGRRGSGKTHTAVIMAEEMLAAGVQIVVLDPLDVWWGLRVSKDGKSAGFAIYVAGGSHEDMPLAADAGRVIADAVVDRGLSIVLSLRHLSKTDQRRFVGDFCERLYDRKADPKHRTALHVFIDEADAFVPQRLMPGAERCFGAVDTLVRRGRSSGLAPTLISQRPQVINKDVLSQTEVLVSHQLTGPQDRKALQAWIEANDTEHRGDEFMASLASLPKGHAWFWSPGLLHVFDRVHVRDRQTFDSSATPKAGVSATASPKAFAAVDLEQLTAEIKATIERQKADDPRELKKELARVRQELEKAQQVKADRKQASAETTKPALTDADRALLEKVGAQVAEVGRLLTVNTAFDVDAVVDRVKQELEQFKTDVLNEQSDNRAAFVRALDGKAFQKVLGKLATLNSEPIHPAATMTHPRSPLPRRMAPASTSHVEDRPARQVSPGRADGLPEGEAAVLAAIAQFGSVDRRRLTILTRYKRRTRDTYIQRLGQRGYVTVTGGLVESTAAGIAALGSSFQPLPTGTALREHWRQRLPEGERRIFDLLISRGGEPVARAALDDPTGFTRRTRDTYLQRLMARGVVEDAGRGMVRASEELFT
jgi:hypothetical protein